MNAKEATTYSIGCVVAGLLLAFAILKGCENDGRRLECASATYATCVGGERTDCADAARRACGFGQ